MHYRLRAIFTLSKHPHKLKTHSFFIFLLCHSSFCTNYEIQSQDPLVMDRAGWKGEGTSKV